MSLQLHWMWARDKFGPWCISGKKKQICLWGMSAQGRGWVIIDRSNKKRKWKVCTVSPGKWVLCCCPSSWVLGEVHCEGGWIPSSKSALFSQLVGGFPPMLFLPNITHPQINLWKYFRACLFFPGVALTHFMARGVRSSLSRWAPQRSHQRAVICIEAAPPSS